MEKVKEYKKGDFVIVWKPEKCIHSGICVKTLPEVYKPDQRPWINPENTAERELKEHITSCPSGALSFRIER